LINTWREFVEVIPVSALTGENLETLEIKILEYLPPGPRYFPSDQITEETERFLVAELIREKIFQFTGDEIPYAEAVKVEEFKLREEKNLLYIRAYIFVEKDSQKKIIIGAGGQKLKQIGTHARVEIENRFGHQVYLDLWVKVREKWRQNWKILQELGYH
jgi:GTP-binding protein Era